MIFSQKKHNDIIEALTFDPLHPLLWLYVLLPHTENKNPFFKSFSRQFDDVLNTFISCYKICKFIKKKVIKVQSLVLLCQHFFISNNETNNLFSLKSLFYYMPIR